jgi:hypothetical protein
VSEDGIIGSAELRDAPYSSDSLTCVFAAAQEYLKQPDSERYGALPGVKGMYSGTKINGKRSPTSAWQDEMEKSVAKDFVRNAEVQWQKPNGKPVLLEHFFGRQRLDIPAPALESGGKTYNGSESSSLEAEIIDIWSRSPSPNISTNALTTSDGIQNNPPIHTPTCMLSPMVDHPTPPNSPPHHTKQHSQPHIAPPLLVQAKEAIEKLDHILRPC